MTSPGSSGGTYAFTPDCTACGACLLTCPEHAIVAGLPLQVRADRCTSCGECVEVCPADAVVEVGVPTAALPRGALSTAALPTAALARAVGVG